MPKIMNRFTSRLANSSLLNWISKKQSRVAIASSILAIMAGLFIGFIIMFLFNPMNSFRGIFLMLGGWLFRDNILRDVGRWLFTTGPLILTGLSVGFAFKTGLFNIGATGQYTLGLYVAIMVGTYGEMLGPFQWVIAMLAGMLAGSIIGLLNGFLKAKFNVHEVITSIMFNYIVMYMVNSLIKNDLNVFDFERSITRTINPQSFLPTLGLRTIFPGSNIDIGILIAIGVAFLVWVILYKTSFGFELQVTGTNRFAAKYSGINEMKAIMLSMMIAGAIAGLGGTLYALASGSRNLGTFYEPADILIPTGFEGIAVALLGMSHPIGTIFSASYITFIQTGGQFMQGLGIKIEIIEVIIASILYCSAIALIFKEWLNKMKAQSLEEKRKVT
jgi:simple sugar transport system permease protein